MMTKNLLNQIFDHLDETIKRNTELGRYLWLELLKSHPADIADLLANLSREDAEILYLEFPENLKLNVFRYLSNQMKVFCLSFLKDPDRSFLLTRLSIDDLTDVFDELSDEELKKYLRLLHKNDRELVLSLLQFNEDTAGGIMDTSVLTLMQDFTVEKCIQILQRLQPNKDLHHTIYVTDQDNKLTGHIGLEDLVLKSPKERLTNILRKNELVFNAEEDKETVAQKMRHYQLTTAPVIDNNNVFLGIIPGETLVDIIEEEAAEDVYHMSALANIKDTYFETPFITLFTQRSSILLILLLAQNLSSLLIKSYKSILNTFDLVAFITMLTSTGGNTSSQTSALVIKGLASGEITEANMRRFLLREFFMALMIATLLGAFTFVRVYYQYQKFWESLVVGSSLSIIVMVSVILGSCIPLFLKALKLDPALSAGPLLGTFMDVIGLFIYCMISQAVLS